MQCRLGLSRVESSVAVDSDAARFNTFPLVAGGLTVSTYPKTAGLQGIKGWGIGGYRDAAAH
jgi:hypothetical protein